MSRNTNEILDAKTIHDHFSDAELNAIQDDIEFDIEELEPTDGLGIFIREDVPTSNGPQTLAAICEWHKRKKTCTVSFLKYHLFTGDMPDALLDDINTISEKTDNPVWKHEKKI